MSEEKKIQEEELTTGNLSAGQAGLKGEIEQFSEDSRAVEDTSSQEPAATDQQQASNPARSGDQPGRPQPPTENMEVHHHSHAHGKKSRKDYFWEFLMLFLAVTLGFFVENMREHYIERKRAVEYANNLLYDLTKDTARLSDDILYYKWRENSVDSLIQLLSSNERQYPAKIFYRRLRAMDTWRVPVGFSNTYDDLKTSGLLRYFTDNGVAGKLKSYYQGYVTFSFWEEELAEFIKTTSEPFLDRNFEGRYYVSESSEKQSWDKFVFPVPDTAVIVMPDPVKKNLLNMAYRMRYKKIGVATISDFCEAQKKEANDMIALLKEEYHLE
ncbi:MAG TPA: hypothetical protein VFW07_13605 [Parafilimonas sp.]|nr:hypothetical protein [Parafilimonas sp.]